MIYSNFFIPTLKENPSDAEVVSHKLMLRAGMIRKLAAGVYTYLPLGLRVIRKFEEIVRQEMNRAGAIELLMPGVQPAELWQESGRWDQYGKELLRFNDRKDSPFCLGPTHEEVITDLVRKEIRSYRQMPVNFYQIQAKFRDEIRPRFGLMRGREFIMKDSYSFDADSSGTDLSYEKMYQAYVRIFTRCGLRFRAVEADTGSIGGSSSHEFMVLAESGEDAIASCNSCQYAANIEKAEPGSVDSPDTVSSCPPDPMQTVSTPGIKTISEVAAYLKTDVSSVLKTLAYTSGEGAFVLASLRGDHELNEIKLKNLMGWVDIRLATDDEISGVLGLVSGFIGPVGLPNTIRLVADNSVSSMRTFVSGGNRSDVHYVNTVIGRDVHISGYADIRNVVAGDNCPRCSGGRLEMWRGIEVGHVFKLGTKYSKAMNANFLDAEGKENVISMGCYGIGIGRTVAASIEQNNDENGIIFPVPIAPFHCSVVALNPKEDAVMSTSRDIYRKLLGRGVDALLDDRDERPGFKFKDNDLIGIPLRIVVGSKGLAEGKVELKFRGTGEMIMLSMDEAVDRVSDIVKQALTAADDI